MKRALSLLLILFLLFSLCSCDHIDLGLERNYENEYDKAGNVVRRTVFDDEGKVSYETRWTYYESGAVKTKTVCDDEGKVSYEECWTYYESGAVKTETVFDSSADIFTESEFSEDGLTEHRYIYTDTDILFAEIYAVYYAEHEDDWPQRLDDRCEEYRYCERIYYNEDGSVNSHTSEEFRDDYTSVIYEYNQDGQIWHEWFYVVNENSLEAVKHIYHSYGFRDDKLVIEEIYNVSLDGTGEELIQTIYYD